jgi:hypothetical protein
MGADQ